MHEDVIQDLKQFIATTVSQATADMATKDDVALVRREIHQGFAHVQAAIADAMTAAHDEMNTQSDKLEQRVTKLEQHPAM